jgi:hypothetical protein
VGETHFIVAAYTFTDTDDISSIWIDPDPSTFETDNVPLPTMTHVGNNITGGASGQIASILLRQSPAPYSSIDELRVGSTWADVTPVPEPMSLALVLIACGLTGERRFRGKR